MHRERPRTRSRCQLTEHPLIHGPMDLSIQPETPFQRIASGRSRGTIPLNVVPPPTGLIAVRLDGMAREESPGILGIIS